MMFYFWLIYYPLVEVLSRTLSRDTRSNVEPGTVDKILARVLRYITGKPSAREWDRIAWAYAVRYFRDQSVLLGIRVEPWRDVMHYFRENAKAKLHHLEPREE